MEQLMTILNDLRPDVDFENEYNLVGSGILDSFDIITLVGELGETFGVEISALDLVPENFNSAEEIWALIQRLQE